jgi:transposase-like protein
MATRRQFSREFKFEAVRLVRESGVSVAQAARDLDVHENVLRKWMRERVADPQHAFPGKGVMKPETIIPKECSVCAHCGCKLISQPSLQESTNEG